MSDDYHPSMGVLGDPRRAADRAATQCEHCGRYVRWIVNSTSARVGARMEIEAKVIATDAWFEPAVHSGLVAVFADGSGFTVSRFTPTSLVEGALLYRCHWDICDEAARIRDIKSRELAQRRDQAAHRSATERHAESAARYAEWRHGKE